MKPALLNHRNVVDVLDDKVHLEAAFAQVSDLDARRVRHVQRAAEIRAEKKPVTAFLERHDYSRTGTLPVPVAARVAAATHEVEADKLATVMDATLLAVIKEATRLRRELREARR
jgi:hypothetical protein